MTRPDTTRSQRPDASRSPRPDASRSARPDASRSARPDASRSARPDARNSRPSTTDRGRLHADRRDSVRPRYNARHRPERVAYDVGRRKVDARRPYHGHRSHYVPPHRTRDHRYARPHWRHVHHHPHAHHRVPVHRWYKPWYTRWYQHPYYRWTYSTSVVVAFGFATAAWVDHWVPPPRPGWVWVPGYWAYGYWHPGHWQPVRSAPVNYSYVPGWWETDDVYVDGYYRVERRKGWEWVDGYYLDDGTYVRGHWVPADQGPAGYVWEPGFYDGEVWVDGFWRPEYRSGFTWVSSYYDEDGIFHSGYWMPTEQVPGHVWVPGWFDGNSWVEGYWVRDDEYRSADIDNWTPPDGWDDGWEVGEGFGWGEVIENNSPGAWSGGGEGTDLPLALPIPDDD